MEIDAVLSPCAAPIDEHELSFVERMERMGDTEARYLIDQIECSRLLFGRAASSRE